VARADGVQRDLRLPSNGNDPWNLIAMGRLQRGDDKALVAGR
jgi:hypothetical protein